MLDQSSEMNAALRAMRGESDPDAVLPAISDIRLFHVLAMAPDVHSSVRVVAGLACRKRYLLNPQIVDDPSLQATLLRAFDSDVAGGFARWTLAMLAPAGWGAAHAPAIIESTRNRGSHEDLAAALIGPCDDAAALLTSPFHAAFAIRRWGESGSGAPTEWANALSPTERDRLIAMVRRDASSVALCAPWLPPEAIEQTNVNGPALEYALDAFAAASPTAHAQHLAFVQRLVDHAEPKHLGALTRLACAMGEDDIWQRVQTLIQESPDDAWRVVAAAPWPRLAEHVRSAILKHADQFDICAAIAAACGERDATQISITKESAAAFFAALDPRVWDALPPAAQWQWRQALDTYHAHLAVRSLGLRPDVLSWAKMTDDMVYEAWLHAGDHEVLHAALLPVSLRDLELDQEYALISAMTTLPPDPGAFFCIASGCGDASVIAPAHAALRTPADLAFAVALQRCGDCRYRVRFAGTILQHMLHGKTPEDLDPFLALLTDAARAALLPDPDEMVARLAPPERQEALRGTLDRLASLPLDIALPTQVTLRRWMAKRTSAAEAAADVAYALRRHGDVFLDLVDSLADDHLRTALLPLPPSTSDQQTLRTLAREDAYAAFTLAHALQNRSCRAAVQTVQSLPQWVQSAVTPDVDTLVAQMASPDKSDKMRAALMQIASAPPEIDGTVRFALGRLATRGANDVDAAHVLAHAMRDSGDVFLTIVDSLADDRLRKALLPLPKRPPLATALRRLASHDADAAHRLAHEMHDRSWREALRTLLFTPPDHASVIWSALHPETRDALASEVFTTKNAGTPFDDSMRDVASSDPIAALALTALHSDERFFRNAALAALAARTEWVRTMWNRLPSEMRQTLSDIPDFGGLIAETGAPHDAHYRRSRR